MAAVIPSSWTAGPGKSPSPGREIGSDLVRVWDEAGLFWTKQGSFGLNYIQTSQAQAPGSCPEHALGLGHWEGDGATKRRHGVAHVLRRLSRACAMLSKGLQQLGRAVRSRQILASHHLAQT